MKTGLNCEQPFVEWSREFEKNVTCIVVNMFYESSGATDNVSMEVHEIMEFVLKEAGISPAMLQVFEFISTDDNCKKEGGDQ